MQTLNTTDFHKDPKEAILNMVGLQRTTVNDKNFQDLIKELNNDLRARYTNHFYRYDIDIEIDNLNTAVLGLINGTTVGCGCFKDIGRGTVEIKRMFVNPYFRGLGISSSILTELTTWAKELGYTSAVLETGKQQYESISLYKKYGFEIVDNFGPYIGVRDSVCMSKTL